MSSRASSRGPASTKAGDASRGGTNDGSKLPPVASGVKGKPVVKTEHQSIHDFVASIGRGGIYKKISHTVFNVDAEELKRATAAEKNFFAVDRGEVDAPRRRTSKVVSQPDIMMMLDTNKLPLVQLEFQRHDDGLSMRQFVGLMMSSLNSTAAQMSDSDLVSLLCELFQLVDIDNDGTMGWDEFYAYVHQQGMTLRLDGEQIRQYQSGPVLNLDAMEKRTDRVFGFPYTDWIGSVESNGSSLRMLDLKGMKRLASLDHNSAILRVMYINERRLMVVSACDHCLYIWDSNSTTQRIDKAGFALCGRAKASVSQTALCYDSQASTLWSGGVDGVMYVWSLTQNLSTRMFDCKLKMPKPGRDGHTGTIKVLLDAPALNGVFSGSLDTTIRLWDKDSGLQRAKYKGHTKGVIMLEYAPKHRILVSAGAENEAFIWNPFLDKVTFKLKGHIAPLVGMHIVPNTPQLVTCDRSGCLRVWDLQSCDCVQVITASRQLDQVNALLAQPQYNRVMVSYHRQVQFLEFSKSDKPELTDDVPIVTALYNDITSTFMTVSGHSLRLWDADSGKIKEIINNVAVAEITTCCLDDNERKLYVGCDDGQIFCVNYGTGVVIKTFQAHKSEVSAIAYVMEDRSLVTASWDGTVLVHDDAVNDRDGKALRSMKGHDKDVTCLALSWRLKLIASSGADKVIQLWHYDFGKLEGTLRGHAGEVTTLTFIEPYALLASTDILGNICIWATYGYLRGALLCRLKRTHSKTGRPAGVLTATYTAGEAGGRFLFFGDEFGRISAYDMGPLIDSMPTYCVAREIPRRPSGDELMQRRRADVRVPWRGPRDAEFDVGVVYELAGKGAERKASFHEDRTAQLTASLPNKVEPIVLRYEWRGHGEGVKNLAWHSRPKILISVGSDKLVKLWDPSRVTEADWSDPLAALGDGLPHSGGSGGGDEARVAGASGIAASILPVKPNGSRSTPRPTPTATTSASKDKDKVVGANIDVKGGGAGRKTPDDGKLWDLSNDSMDPPQPPTNTIAGGGGDGGRDDPDIRSLTSGSAVAAESKAPATAGTATITPGKGAVAVTSGTGSATARAAAFSGSRRFAPNLSTSTSRAGSRNAGSKAMGGDDDGESQASGTRRGSVRLLDEEGPNDDLTLGPLFSQIVVGVLRQGDDVVKEHWDYVSNREQKQSARKETVKTVLTSLVEEPFELSPEPAHRILEMDVRRKALKEAWSKVEWGQGFVPPPPPDVVLEQADVPHPPATAMAGSVSGASGRGSRGGTAGRGRRRLKTADPALAEARRSMQAARALLKSGESITKGSRTHRDDTDRASRFGRPSKKDFQESKSTAASVATPRRPRTTGGGGSGKGGSDRSGLKSAGGGRSSAAPRAHPGL